MRPCLKPGMLTHKSRGIDKMPAVFFSGSTLISIIVSVRNGPVSLSALRWSMPSNKMLNFPGGQSAIAADGSSVLVGCGGMVGAAVSPGAAVGIAVGVICGIL